MDPTSLSADPWSRATPEERLARATELATALTAVRTRRDGALPEVTLVGVEGEAATFDVGGVRLVLVPGRTVTLGATYDLEAVARALAPETLDAAVQRTSKPLDFGAWQRDDFTPRREVTIAPFLLAPDPVEEQALRGDDCFGEDVWDDEDSCEDAMRRGIDATLRASGYRLPSLDEWELAYGDGAPSIFPWGDAPTAEGHSAWYRRLPAEPWTTRYGVVFRGTLDITSDVAMRGGDGHVLALAIGSLANFVRASAWQLTRERMGGGEHVHLQENVVRRVMEIDFG